MADRPLLAPPKPPHGLAAAALVPLLDERERVLVTLAATRPDVRADLAEARAFFAWLRYLARCYADWRMSAPGPADVDTADMPAVSGEIGTTEAARLLACSARHVRRLADAGALEGRKVGSAWVLNRASIATYVEVAGGGSGRRAAA